MKPPIRIANCSGYYGDRLGAAREMVSGGPIDVLTGDWLAELTMLILAKTRSRSASGGFARTFVSQMEDVMGECLARGIRVVSNAGGLDPKGCADAVEEVGRRLGLDPVVAYVEGDDIVSRLDELRASGVTFDNLDTGVPLGDRSILTANAYIGGWGIAQALAQGANVVITGRCTDASLVVGPACWHHEWAHHDWDAIAGAVVAGHVIECGTQATGGNYAFFGRVPGMEHLGFPIAEVASDGSSVITKHEGQGGQVTTGTVTAQLLYEIRGPRYENPDVTARFDTITLDQEGPDRVRISGVRGEPPPPTLKVCMNYAGGYRTTVTLMLCGLDIEEKAAVFEEALWASLPSGKSGFEHVDSHLVRTDHEDALSNDAAVAQLRITVKDRDERKVGRPFVDAVTGLALATYPGFFSAPSNTQSYGVYWPATVPSELVRQEVVIQGIRSSVCVPMLPRGASSVIPAALPMVTSTGATVRLPLGTIAGARSGDKGGNANVGVWVETDSAFAWLDDYLSIEHFRSLVPDAEGLVVERYSLPNLRSINFFVLGLLGEGVASSTRVDAQAKSLGEYLRSRYVDIPRALLRDEPDAVAGSHP